MSSASDLAGARYKPSLRAPRPSVDTTVSIAMVALLLVAWQLASRTGVLDARVVSSPTAIVDAILVNRVMLWDGAADTFVRLIVGLVLGVIPGIAIGLTMGMFRWPRALLSGVVAILFMVPRIALFPIVLILVGINETSNVIMVALGPLFIMIINAQTAAQNIDRIYLDVAKSFETPKRDLYRYVLLPATLPVILAGIRVALGFALLAVIAVEFLVGESGLGYIIWQAWNTLSLELSIAGMIVATIMGAILYVIVGAVERRMVPWSSD